jgi:hypothetical protein
VCSLVVKALGCSRPDEVKFQIYLILAAALGPGVYSASNRIQYRNHFWGVLELMRGAHNLTAIYESIV